jgi:hypothetical protein
VVKGRTSSGASRPKIHSASMVPPTNCRRTCVPNGVNGGFTAGAGKSLTPHAKEEVGAKTCDWHWWLIGLRK